MSDAQPVITSYYVALPAFVLALVALIWVRTRKVYVLTALSFLALWLAMGRQGYLYKWLLELCPFLGALRYPIKFVVALTFCVPVLAAFGMAFWRKKAAPGFNRRARNPVSRSKLRHRINFRSRVRQSLSSTPRKTR